MAFGHLLMIFMAMLIFNTAPMSNAEKAVLVQTGSSIQLDIQTDKPPQIETLVWMKDESENIMTFINEEAQILTDNAVFNQTTFSLTLKNMQKTDSGFYTAQIFGPINTDVAKYRVSVIDPVDFPVLNWNFTMISVNSCIVDVTCSGHNHTISNSYHSNNCRQEVTSTEMQPLTVYCKEGIVVCNNSNPVSWKNNTVEIKQLCTTYENKSPEENNSSFPLLWIIVIVFSASLMVLVATTVLYCSCKNHNKGAQVENGHTVYAQVQLKNAVQRPLEMLETANPQTVYGFTGEYKQTPTTSQKKRGPEIPAQTQTNNPLCTTYSKIGQHQKPSFATETDHTVYSQVCKSPRGKPHVH